MSGSSRSACVSPARLFSALRAVALIATCALASPVAAETWESIPPNPMAAWSDEHGSPSQRMYNALCLAYGGDPKTFQEFIARGWLPMRRASGCAREYSLVKRAFAKTIPPYIDPAMMARVQKAEWLTPEEVK